MVCAPIDRRSIVDRSRSTISKRDSLVSLSICEYGCLFSEELSSQALSATSRTSAAAAADWILSNSHPHQSLHQFFTSSSPQDPPKAHLLQRLLFRLKDPRFHHFPSRLFQNARDCCRIISSVLDSSSSLLSSSESFQIWSSGDHLAQEKPPLLEPSLHHLPRSSRSSPSQPSFQASRTWETPLRKPKKG